MKIKYQEKRIDAKKRHFSETLADLIFYRVLTSNEKKLDLKKAYKMLYDNGNIRDKLSALYTEDINEYADKQIQKFLTTQPEEFYLDFDLIEAFNQELDNYLLSESMNNEATQNIYQKLIGESPKLHRSIYTIHFEHHLETPKNFQLHMERLYNVIKSVIYRVKFNVATEYNGIGSLNYRIFSRSYAKQVQFKHRLLTEEHPQYPQIKLVFSGLHLVLEIIEPIFARLIELAPTTSIEQFLKNLYSHVPTLYNTYFNLEKATKNKAYQETQTAIEKLHPYFYNGSIQQIPTLTQN